MSELEALQVALAAEHAAVHVYGVLGAQTSRTAQPALSASLQDAYAQHRARRDRVIAAVHDLGGTPVGPEAAYDLPERLDDPVAVSRRARELEQAAAETYVFVVASTTGVRRARAIVDLTDAAVRALAFGASPETLPGIG
ncbi:ferritin-like domain-containing protein [Nocardioides ochotonae]|uniref:ferritin-like domain-containing protein n=1 Tax=Nocardioides ochotonae TaxID=2685869 RepID=UPI00140B33BF|nr:ferritin-like domain-containing protein [Nocardioides ochotonae]